MRVNNSLTRYAVVGTLNNLFAYLVFLALYSYTGLFYISSSFAFVVAVFTSFLGHQRFSFAFRGVSSSVACKYAIVYLIGFFSNVLFLSTLRHFISSAPIVQFVSMAIVALELYLLNRFYVFPKDQT